jgi:hypothetical protein
LFNILIFLENFSNNLLHTIAKNGLSLSLGLGLSLGLSLDLSLSLSEPIISEIFRYAGLLDMTVTYIRNLFRFSVIYSLDVF